MSIVTRNIYVCDFCNKELVFDPWNYWEGRDGCMVCGKQFCERHGKYIVDVDATLCQECLPLGASVFFEYTQSVARDVLVDCGFTEAFRGLNPSGAGRHCVICGSKNRERYEYISELNDVILCMDCTEHIKKHVSKFADMIRVEMNSVSMGANLR
jgi:hypothetical protein